MNVGTDENVIKNSYLTMVKNVGSKIKCRWLMKSIKSPNSGPRYINRPITELVNEPDHDYKICNSLQAP